LKDTEFEIKLISSRNNLYPLDRSASLHQKLYFQKSYGELWVSCSLWKIFVFPTFFFLSQNV